MRKKEKKDKKPFRQRLKSASRYILGNPDHSKETGKTKPLFLFVFILYLCYILFKYVL